MKVCQNCQAIHGDDYFGKCPGCGSELGLQKGSVNPDALLSRWHNQGAGVVSETAIGRSDGPGVTPALVQGISRRLEQEFPDEQE